MAIAAMNRETVGQPAAVTIMPTAAGPSTKPTLLPSSGATRLPVAEQRVGNEQTGERDKPCPSIFRIDGHTP